ncbi:hypothetical protein L596_004904 [Steinernema carpocapsae]|uniref:Uncharacterized protein n=1 Tax=Steinernema carpocapsae TaxID=34508 RepID=A0A4U8V0V0_STECR|nr:hypothetical protein L596_004904 [Steinernema carpocapsae]
MASEENYGVWSTSFWKHVTKFVISETSSSASKKISLSPSSASTNSSSLGSYVTTILSNVDEYSMNNMASVAASSLPIFSYPCSLSVFFTSFPEVFHFRKNS